MNARVTDDDFAAVRSFLLQAAGLTFDESRRAGLEAVLMDRLQALAPLGPRTVASYLAALRGPQADQVERALLLDAVTVQETHFLRNPPQMEALRRTVLPELLHRAAARGRPLTVWSAGCSTGEEPYSLAMMLLELVSASGTALELRVLATDVSEAAIQVAQRGMYAGRTLRLVPPGMQERWFEPAPGGLLAISSQVRSLVEFRVHNLIADPPPYRPGEVDLVVCRNVTIYLERPATAALIKDFHMSLADGGYLLLGHSETLWRASEGYTLFPVGDAFLYRRDPRRARVPARRLRAALAPIRTPTAATPVAPARVVRGTGAPSSATADPRGADARSLCGQARAELSQGHYAAAAGLAQRATEVDPLHAPGYLVVGLALCTLGRDSAAVGPLRKAVYLDPGAGAAHFVLAGALARLGQHASAAASYQAAAETVAGLGSHDPHDQHAVLGGRAPADLVDLCLRLADTSRQIADGVALAVLPRAEERMSG